VSDLHDQNRRAIEQGFREMNARLSEMHDRLNKTQAAISILQAEILQVKQQSLSAMISKIGPGPTSN